MKTIRKILLAALCLLACGNVTLLVLSKIPPKDSSGIEPKNTEISETEKLEEKIDKKLQSMSLDEKIGQLLFVRVPKNKALEEIEKYNFGGYILFDRDFENETPESISEKIKTWQNESKISMFIGIDEEGGTVSRLSRAGFANFESPQSLFEQGGFDLIEKTENEKIEIFKKLGINVNFAPVADTCTNQTAFIYDRSFGKNANETAKFVKNVVEFYSKSGISATLKHFPGYGNNPDTHFGVAIDERGLDDFKNSDFLPFEAGIEAGADFIMFSHNIIKSIDSENPASLSKTLHNILKNELNFEKIMITDDLSMDAVNKFYQGEYEKEVQAVLAGNNMLIVSDYETAFTNIKNAIENEILDEQTINDAIKPVLFKKLLPEKS